MKTLALLRTFRFFVAAVGLGVPLACSSSEGSATGAVDAALRCQTTGTCTTTKDAGHVTEDALDVAEDAGHLTGFDTGAIPPADGGFILDGDLPDVEADAATDAATDDTGGACTGSETSCNGACTDTTTDPANCGSCGNQCAGTGTCTTSTCSSSTNDCSHSPCVTGAALSETCDPYNDNTTQAVCGCDGDTACCTTSWDSQCVAEARQFCDSVGGCEDPMCPGS